MKFREWINYKVNVDDIIYNCSDPKGFDKDNILIPLGCAKPFKNIKNNKEKVSLLTNHPKVNTKLLLYSFGLTDRNRIYRETNIFNRFTKNVMFRSDFKKILDKNYTMERYNIYDYFENIGTYKFVISPEGNGIDCYRHYETWISKGIPIIERNPFIAKKYSTLPILWTKDYSEINDVYLKNKWKEFMESNKEYNFGRLLLNSYEPSTREKIRYIRDVLDLVNSKWSYNFTKI